jgi:TM2 domain-containing membrane protein YozV
MHCTTCGKALTADARFCPSCGAAVQSTSISSPRAVFCQNCGWQQSVGASFCVQCGARFAVPAGAGSTTNVYVQAAPQHLVTRSGVSPKSRLIALLLVLFLGWLGIHRFYLGKIGSGVVMLILTLTVVGFIITFFWVVIDFFVILLGNERDGQGWLVEQWGV